MSAVQQPLSARSLLVDIAPGTTWLRKVESRPLDPPPGWPLGDDGLHHDALCGFFGPFIEKLYPTTIASAPGMLFQSVALMGNLVSLDVWTGDEENQIHPVDWVMVCGLPGAGAKGTSLQVVRHWFEKAEPQWAETCIHQSGLTTGEGLLALFRDASEVLREDGSTVRDPGAPDKRGVAIQEEMATVFNKMRSSDSLTGHMLDAWYSRAITNLSATNARARLRASGYRLSLIAHIQPDKWAEAMSPALVGNGFASRFLFCAVHKSKDINRADPDRPRIAAYDAAWIVDAIKAVKAHAESLGGYVPFTADASDFWERHAPAVCWVPQGDFANVMLRAEEHVLRLALVYAVADRAREIDVRHMRAACACWSFSVSSAIAMFRLIGMTPNGDVNGHSMKLAQAALVALRDSGRSEAVLTLTDMTRLLHNHASAMERNRARDELAGFGALVPIDDGSKSKRYRVVPEKLEEFLNAA